MTPLLRPIVARINGLTQEIKRLKANTRINHSIKQITLAHLKMEARHTMLAYAFIRRIPYRVVEASCNEKPIEYQLTRILTSFDVSRKKSWEYNGKTCSPYYHTFTDTSEVGAWLNEPVVEPAVEATVEVSLVQAFIDGIKSLVGAQ